MRLTAMAIPRRFQKWLTLRTRPKTALTMDLRFVTACDCDLLKSAVAALLALVVDVLE